MEEITKQSVCDLWIPLITNLLTQQNAVLPECFDTLELARKCVKESIERENAQG